MNNKKTVNFEKKNVIKIFITIILAALLIINTDCKELVKGIGYISIRNIIIAIVIMVAVSVLNAIRWKLILNDISYGRLLMVTLEADFFSFVLPGQLFGEASKIGGLKYKGKAVDVVLSSIIMDKILGFIALFLVGLYGIMSTDKKEIYGFRYIFILIIILMVTTLYIFRINYIRNKITVIFEYGEKSKSKIIVKISGVLKNIFNAWIYWTENSRMIIKASLISIIAALLNVLQLYIIGIQFDENIVFSDFAWMHCLLSVILLLPISFAGIGVRDISLAGCMEIVCGNPQYGIIISAILLLLKFVAACLGGVVLLYDQYVNKS